MKTIGLSYSDPDALRVLARALELARDLYTNLGRQAGETAAREANRRQAAEAQRNERRAAEFHRRASIADAMLAQLDGITTLTNPKGT